MTDADRLATGLRSPGAYPHPAERIEHIETHISHVFLAGDYAYKVKKPLDLGFLDFSTLARRRFFCEEEIRLNGRLAPHIYLDVVPITGREDAPRVGGEGEPLEYAVRMRRFPQDRLLTRLPVTGELADRIAERVACFHGEIPAATPESGFGTPEAVLRPMRNNFTQIRARVRDPEAVARLDPLEAWTVRRWEALTPVIQARLEAGRVRECHGDMHRGNIALVDGEILIFDGIEFNPDLRWIDTMSEVAFLIMDLDEADEAGPARRLLNRYLELGGDYGGLAVLDFYKVYRAMVRAKVTAIRLGQPDVEPEEARRDWAEYDRYLALAERYVRPRRPRLILTHGVSGSGKTRLAIGLRERLPLIHVRSDVERKRLHGLAAEARTRPGGLGTGIYTPEAGERTYTRLLELARTILDARYDALIDAAFLRADQRRPFLALAGRLGVECVILDLQAPEPVLRERVAARAAEGRDPSEAGLLVLERQLQTREPLSVSEQRLAVALDTAEAGADERLVGQLEGA